MKMTTLLLSLICIVFARTNLAAEVKIKVKEESDILYYDVRCSNVPLGMVLGALSAAGDVYCKKHDFRQELSITVLFPLKADSDCGEIDYVTGLELQNYESMSLQELARFQDSVLETPVGMDISHRSLLDTLMLIASVCNHAVIVADAKIIILPCKYLNAFPLPTGLWRKVSEKPAELYDDF